nr:MaoC/PaaZ C-terminal domain-containing protein [Paenibacillus sp. 32O-W]
MPNSLSYGYDRLRFIKPVFIGDTIRVKVTAKDQEGPSRASRTGESLANSLR